MLSHMDKADKPWVSVASFVFITFYRYDLVTFFKNSILALAGIAQWIESRPEHQRVAGLIPSQGKCLGCRPGAQ